MVLEMSHEYEYHFVTNFTLWFHALSVHIGHIRKIYLEWNKIDKYSIHRYIYVKIEHILCMNVCWSRKKFGKLEMIFLILCRELLVCSWHKTKTLGTHHLFVESIALGIEILFSQNNFKNSKQPRKFSKIQYVTDDDV
jgi:hypothetical protein